MNHTPNQISADEKDLSEVKMHIMKKSIFPPKAQVCICWTGKDENWQTWIQS